VAAIAAKYFQHSLDGSKRNRLEESPEDSWATTVCGLWALACSLIRSSIISLMVAARAAAASAKRLFCKLCFMRQPDTRPPAADASRRQTAFARVSRKHRVALQGGNQAPVEMRVSLHPNPMGTVWPREIRDSLLNLAQPGELGRGNQGGELWPQAGRGWTLAPLRRPTPVAAQHGMIHAGQVVGAKTQTGSANDRSPASQTYFPWTQLVVLCETTPTNSPTELTMGPPLVPPQISLPVL
jgi:hypothetical protein